MMMEEFEIVVRKAVLNFPCQWAEAEATAASDPALTAIAFVAVPVSREVAERAIACPWGVRLLMRSSPKAAMRRAEGAGLDGESADRAIVDVAAYIDRI
jgi:hypothetical protein